MASVSTLMEKASDIAGGRQWEDTSFVATLDLLLRSCDATARLTPRGRHVLDSVVVRHLVNRLLVEAEASARPGAAATPVGPAVVVTGLPRTGTTLLQNLLSLDPAARTLRLWEALRPVPSDPGNGTPERDLVRQAEVWLERFHEMVPGFRPIHASTAEGPEECDALLQNEFASQHFNDMFDARAYSDWLGMVPMFGEYRSYARQLGLLRRPDDGERRWVLKSPSHLGHLDALLAACPQVTIVHCHRHPFEAVPSYASLMLTLRRAYSDDVAPDVVGQQALRRAQTALARARAVRREGPGPFLDVGYGDLVRRPVATVAALYEQLGRPLAPGVAASMTAWVARHPQHEHGQHRYSLDDFGLTTASVTQAFRRYLDGDTTLLV